MPCNLFKGQTLISHGCHFGPTSCCYFHEPDSSLASTPTLNIRKCLWSSFIASLTNRLNFHWFIIISVVITKCVGTTINALEYFWMRQCALFNCAPNQSARNVSQFISICSVHSLNTNQVLIHVLGRPLPVPPWRPTLPVCDTKRLWWLSPRPAS